MVKKILFLSVLVLIVSCIPSNNLTIGFCPTMQDFVTTNYPNYNYVVFDSAASALISLNNDEVDKIIIGRKAYTYENINLKETMLDEGYNLIASKRKVIRTEDLQNIKIASIHEINIEGLSLFIVDNKKEGLLGYDALLISWEDFNDYELLVVLDGLKKDVRFRTPFLYQK
ncbi:MAG: hypothetical protein ACMXX9_00540 [Candidatus Woesearchaeota archaeon]